MTDPTPESVTAVQTAVSRLYEVATSLAEVYAIDRGLPAPLIVRWDDLTTAQRAAYGLAITGPAQQLTVTAVRVSALHQITKKDPR